MGSPFQKPATGADAIPAAERPGRMILLIVAGIAALGAAAWGTVSARDNADLVAAAAISEPALVAEVVEPVTTAAVEPSAEPAVNETEPQKDIGVRIAAASLWGSDEDLSALPAGSARFGGAIGKPEFKPAFARRVSGASPDDGSRFGQEKVDAASTASIAVAYSGDVSIAESESEVLSMEAELASQGVEEFADAPVDDTAVVEAEAREDGLRPARAAKWVNMRAGPDNGARVLAVVPFDAAILAERGCRHWCEAVYKGKKGFIYKTFIR